MEVKTRIQIYVLVLIVIGSVMTVAYSAYASGCYTNFVWNWFLLNDVLKCLDNGSSPSTNIEFFNGFAQASQYYGTSTFGDTYFDDSIIYGLDGSHSSGVGSVSHVLDGQYDYYGNWTGITVTKAQFYAVAVRTSPNVNGTVHSAVFDQTGHILYNFSQTYALKDIKSVLASNYSNYHNDANSGYNSPQLLTFTGSYQLGVNNTIAMFLTGYNDTTSCNCEDIPRGLMAYMDNHNPIGGSADLTYNIIILHDQTQYRNEITSCCSNFDIFYYSTSGIALSSLSDVSINSPTTNQELVYNGTKWTNQDENNTDTTICANATSSHFGLCKDNLITLRTLTHGTNINLVLNSTDIQIQNTNPESTSCSDVGSSPSATLCDGGNVNIKSLKSGTGITMNNGADQVTINNTGIISNSCTTGLTCSGSNPSTFTLNDNGQYCDYAVLQIQSGDPRTIEGIKCSTNEVLYSSTNASFVFNSLMTLINNNNGGVIEIHGYTITHPYNITTAIILPDSGRLELKGQGAWYSTLKIPAGSDNDMFKFVGSKSVDSFFNYLHDFNMEGNDGLGGVSNTGFNFSATTHGMHDSRFDNLFIEHFKKYDVYITTPNSWNMMFTNDVFELAGDYCFYHQGGSDTRIVDSKFLFCKGVYALYLGGGLNTVQASWFYQNDKNAILLANSPNVINSNKFYDNGLSASNTYHDIALSASVANVIVSNTFSGSDLTNKTKDAIFISDNVSYNNTIVSNNFASTSTTSFGTGFITGFHNKGVNTITNNAMFNPVGKVTNFIDNSGTYFVSVGGTTSTLTNGTTYVISDTPVFITSTSGTTVSITLSDNKGNTIQSGLTTLTQQFMPIGYKIKFTWHTIPTTTVYFQ